MKTREVSHHAVLCSHCEVTTRMEVIGSINDTEEIESDGGLGFDVGTVYELYTCSTCNKLVLVQGHWHEGMEGPEDWRPEVVLPTIAMTKGLALLKEQEADFAFMTRAVEEAKKCPADPNEPNKPKVGAVVACANKLVIAGYRGEIKKGEHAEYTVLEKKCANEELVGATVFTTLEPCTTRNPPKHPCVDRLIQRKVSRVVIGMLDPDERIRGRGVLALRKANIRVDFFPPHLMAKLEELNREFIRDREKAQVLLDPVANVAATN